VRENLTAGNLRTLLSSQFISARAERRQVEPFVRALQIRTRSLEQSVTQLSGGNQQKVALGRSLVSSPRVYLVDEPTQGVDAGARAEIYRILRNAANRGAGIVVLSSDAVELAGLCERVAVFVRGRIASVLEGDELAEDSIVAAAVTHVDEAKLEDATPVYSEPRWGQR